jgi:hypothetical protein
VSGAAGQPITYDADRQMGTIFLRKPEQAKMSRMQDVEVSGDENCSCVQLPLRSI